MKYDSFISQIGEFYKNNKRAMPWREDISPYSIFISEVMLQQTQVSRVLIKYPVFIKAFPSFVSLAHADLPSLLSQWQGMGYNRRALYLKAAAQIITERYKGLVPNDPTVLDELPGIGYATACSITAFTYNSPVVFIETNIRRVYIHHFFKNKENILDEEIMPLVAKTLDRSNPREWYWALMDYGAYLSKQGENPNKKSKHYVKQKQFKGSVREVRGGVLKLLLSRPHSMIELRELYDDLRLNNALGQLEKEQFIVKENNKFRIKK